MNKLVAFDGSHLQNFQILADLKVDEDNPSRLILNFQIHDEMSEVDLPSENLFFSAEKMQKKDELWKMTCFEMFLNPTGHKQYYEFNFSLEAAWNIYHFAGYRFPQPPVPTQDFEIESLAWKANQLTIALKNKSPFQKFDVGLTAVIKNKKNQITYFALKHESGKPDFHLAGGFTLQRG